MKNSICKTCNNQFFYVNKGDERVFCSIDCYRIEQRKGTYVKEKKLISRDDFLLRAREKHGDKYIYDLSEPLESNGYINYTCPDHGNIKQRINIHINRGCGCQKCGFISMIKLQSKSIDQFIDEARLVHGDTYDYPGDTINSGKDKRIRIICRTHGEFYQLPSNHLKGKGCRACGIIKNTRNKKYSNEYAIKRLMNVHGGRYCYDETIYNGVENKIKIKCHNHGFFHQIYSHHAKGHGCKKCFMENGAGFSRTSYIDLCNRKYAGKSNLYILKCFNESEVFYKVGITCGDIKYRYAKKSDMPYSFDVVYFISGEVGAIWNLEKSIHRSLRNKKHKPKINFSGETECFKSLNSKVESMLDSQDQMLLL